MTGHNPLSARNNSLLLVIKISEIIKDGVIYQRMSIDSLSLYLEEVLQNYLHCMKAAGEVNKSQNKTKYTMDPGIYFLMKTNKEKY